MFRPGLGSRLAMAFWTNCVWRLAMVSLWKAGGRMPSVRNMETKGLRD